MSKIILLDRDGTLNVSSSDSTSPLFNILTPHALVLRPRVKEAIAIIKAHGTPVILVTMQRALAKQTLTLPGLAAIHERLSQMLDFTFLDIQIEPAAFNKTHLYDQALMRYPDAKLALFDDSHEERMVADARGIKTYDGTDLYSSVCAFYNLNP